MGSSLDDLEQGDALLLGVVVSMFTAIMVTRFLMNRFVNAGATKTSLYTRVKAEEKEVEA